MASEKPTGRPHAPVRVAIIAPCPPPYGGIARVVENHLQHWQADGVAAHFVPMYVPEKPNPPHGATFHDVARAPDRRWNGLPSYAAALIRAPLTRPWVYRNFVRYNAALSAYIRRHDINVVYGHEIWPAGASAVLQGRINRVGKVVVAYGETYHTIPSYRRQKGVEPYVLRGADHVISTSQHCLDGALARGASLGHSSVIYAGVDIDRFRPGLDGSALRARYQLPLDAVVISVLGLALRRKLDTLLDALENADLGDDVYCLIGGSGDDSDYVEARARAIRGVTVRTLGFVPEEDLPAFYAATDLLVVSPKTIMECMGQSMKEAMACATAVVGARIGGVPEAIQDGVNGVLYEPDDPAALSRALSALSSDPDARRRMGAEGRKTAEATFGAAVAARQTLEVLRAAATGPSDGP